MNWKEILVMCLVIDCYSVESMIMPRSYKIVYLFDIDPATNFSFYGFVEIQFSTQTKTKQLEIYVSDMMVLDEQIKLSGDDAPSLKELTRQDDVLQLDLETDLKDLVFYNLSMPFFGYANKTQGLELLASDGTKQYSIISDYQQAAFPMLTSFYSARSTFTLSIAHYNNYQAFSNMPPIKNNPNSVQDFLYHYSWRQLRKLTMKAESFFVWTHFETSKPMTTSMLGFVVTNMVELGQSGNTSWNLVPLNIWLSPNKKRKAGPTAALSGRMISTFQKILEVEYALPKIDIITLPNLEGYGLRTWGLLVCPEDDLLFDLVKSDWFVRETITERLARRISGQWFGNAMVMESPAQNWLTEGISKYMAMLILQQMEPDWSIQMHFPIQQHLQYILHDDNRASFALGTVFEEMNNFEALDELVTIKSYLLLRMVRKLFSESLFNSALSSFLSTYQYSAAEPDGLWSQQNLKDAATALPDATIDKILDSWITNEGFPVINVKRNYQMRSMSITQKRMAGMCQRPSTERWWVPISVLTKNAQLPLKWLQPDDLEGAFPVTARESEWVIVNHDLIAPIRVNYDQQNWDLIVSELNNTHENIPVAARAKLVSDAFRFAWRGEVKYSTAFELSKYLRRETYWGPFLAAFDALERIDMMLQRKLEYVQFQIYMRYIVSNIYNQNLGLGLVPDVHSDLYKNKLQIKTMYWACHVFILRCRDRALKIFNTWMSNSTSPIIWEFRGAVMTVGATLGGARAWKFLWARAQDTTDHEERLPILLALLHTTHYEFLLKSLDLIISPTPYIRREHRTLMLQEALRKTVNFAVIKRFIYRNTETLRNILGPKFGDAVKTLASRIRNERDYTEFSKWVGRNQPNLVGLGVVIRQAKQDARSNVEWDRKHAKTVVQILRSFQNSEKPKEHLRRRSNELPRTNFYGLRSKAKEFFNALFYRNGSTMSALNPRMTTLFVVLSFCV